MTKSLWGEFPEPSNARIPYEILGEQAALVEENTSGVLLGKVTSRMDGNRFLVTLSIVVPQMNNYKFDIFTVMHGVVPYPAKVYKGRARPAALMSSAVDPIEVNSPEELEAGIERILRSDEVHDTIANLLRMSDQYGSEG